MLKGLEKHVSKQIASHWLSSVACQCIHMWVPHISVHATTQLSSHLEWESRASSTNSPKITFFLINLREEGARGVRLDLFVLFYLYGLLYLSSKLPARRCCWRKEAANNIIRNFLTPCRTEMRMRARNTTERRK
jgi:hypothetical protein